MIFADHLSHNVNPEASKVPTIPGLILEVSSLQLNASLSKLKHIRQESERDPQMLMLKKLIIQGWPKDIKQCHYVVIGISGMNYLCWMVQ